MINVNIYPISLENLLNDGFTLEHSKSMVTIRDVENKTLAEIIYFEETNEILINTEKEFIWCNMVLDVTNCDRNVVYIHYECIKTHSYRYEGTMEVRSK